MINQPITAILLYLPTTFLQSSVLYAVVIALVLIINFSFCRNNNYYLNVRLNAFEYVNIAIISLGIAASPIIVNNYDDIFRGPIIGLFSFFVMIYLSRRVDNIVINYFAYCVAFECAVALLEYLIGKPYLFNSQLSESSIGSDSINSFESFSTDIYSNKVFGLGSSSSSLAYKIYLCLMLGICFNIKFKRVVYIAFAFGVLLTFSRTAVISIFATLVLVKLNTEDNILRKLFYTIVICALISVIAYGTLDLFTKGLEINYSIFTNETVLNALTTNRWYTWNVFVEMVENQYFGNFGLAREYDVGYTVTTNPHNTFIYLYAKYGGVGVAALLLSLYFSVKYSGKAMVIFIPLFFHSVFSVNFGNYFSINDVILLAVINKLYLIGENSVRFRIRGNRKSIVNSQSKSTNLA